MFGFEFLLIVPLVIAPIGLMTGCVAMISPASRSAGQKVSAMAAAVLVLFLPVIFAAAGLRTLGFQQAAERARPLVQAIRDYEGRYGRPPTHLAAVVPEFLAALPARLPELHLVTEPEARGYGGNTWILRADVGKGILNWDLFLYFPNQKYPEAGYGGTIERIEDWAYVHE